MEKHTLSERGPSPVFTNCLILSGFACITFGYLFNNFHLMIGNDALVTRVYFMSLAVGLFLISLSQIKNPYATWIWYSIAELALYNIVDEALDRACIIDWWEVAGAVVVVSYNYTDHKYHIIKYLRAWWHSIKTK